MKPIGDCTFCRIVEGDITSYKIYENQTVLAFLDIKPVSPGHTLVIPKTHYETLENVPTEVMEELARSILIISKALFKALHPEGYFVLQSNKRVAGQEIPHLHFHIVPVWKDLDTWHMEFSSIKFSENEMENMTNKIRSEIC